MTCSLATSKLIRVGRTQHVLCATFTVETYVKAISILCPALDLEGDRVTESRHNAS